MGGKCVVVMKNEKGEPVMEKKTDHDLFRQYLNSDFFCHQTFFCHETLFSTMSSSTVFKSEGIENLGFKIPYVSPLQ